MQWGNFLQVMTIIYVFILPLFVSFDRILGKSNLQLLLMFDIIFMSDRFADLFVGFINKEEEFEPKLIIVLFNNFSSSFYLELVWAFGPFFFNLNELNSINYFLFKIPRYNRLFEMGTAVNIYLDYYGKNWNVFEIQKVQKQSILIQFFIQTMNMIHLLTCTAIMLCIHREYEKSWLWEKK